MKKIPIASERLIRRPNPQRHTLLKLGVALTLSIGLLGCGGGNDSEPVTPRVAQARFGDMKALNASKVSVSDQNGKVLYAQGLDCEQAVNCAMQLEDYKPPAQLSFKLYNPQNQLVSVTDVYRTDQDQFSLSYSDTMMGTYLFRTYAARYDVTPAQLSIQLAGFFINSENLDGTPDHFLELGKLYQQVRKDPKLGYGEVAFYEELKKRLDTHFVLPPDYLNSPVEPVATVASPRLLAAAKDASCPPELEVMVEVVSEYGKYIPYVGEAVGKFFGKLIGATVSKACDESEKVVDQLSEISTKLDEIQEQIHELDAKVVALGYSLEQLKVAVYQVLEGTALGRFYDDFNKIDSYTNMYRHMLNPRLGEQYKNLSEFVKKNGGLKKSTFDGTKLFTLLSNTAEQNQTFKGLALKSNLDSLATAIKLKCEDETQIKGDVVDQRGRCNMMLGKIASEFTQAQTQLALMMKDEIAMINAAYLTANADDRKWIELNFVSPFSTGWETAQAEVNQTLEKNLGVFGSALGSSFVPVLKGLPALVQLGLLVNSECRTDDSTTSAAAVSAWYPNEPDPYLTAHCYNNGKMVKSKLQYKANQGAEVVSRYRNLLGVPVLVTSDLPHTAWFDTGMSAGYNSVEPNENSAKNSLAVKWDPKQFSLNNEGLPSSYNLSPKSNFVLTEACWTPYPWCDRVEHARYIMRKETSLSVDGFEYFTSRINNRNTVAADRALNAIISYTVPADKGVDSGTTLVWQIELIDSALEGKEYNLPHPFTSQWRLRCVTADCSVDGDHLRFKHNSSVSRVSLEGPRDGWKSFVISR